LPKLSVPAAELDDDEDRLLEDDDDELLDDDD
jgi:hypothetical protein